MAAICGCLLIGSLYPRLILEHHVKLVDETGKELVIEGEYRDEIPVKLRYKMINENKVILMTRMASYEQKEGKRCMSIAKYFRTDYVVRHVLKGIIAGTIAFAVCFALYVAYGFEEFMENIYKMDLMII